MASELFTGFLDPHQPPQRRVAEVREAVRRLRALLVFEVFFRAGWVRSVECPPDPFAVGIDAVLVDGAPASELDLRRVLPEEDYQRMMADSERRRLRLS